MIGKNKDDLRRRIGEGDGTAFFLDAINQPQHTLLMEYLSHILFEFGYIVGILKEIREILQMLFHPG